jgi:hypothetical protein
MFVRALESCISQIITVVGQGHTLLGTHKLASFDLFEFAELPSLSKSDN